MSFSLSREGNDTSVLLDLLRATAAQMVCVGHGISFFMPQLRENGLPRMAAVGVLLFFAMSGFVIAHTLVERSRDPNYGFVHFLVDRFARIYSALVPCLLVVFLIDFVTVSVDSSAVVAYSRTVPSFLANIFMLEGYFGLYEQYDSMQWQVFGSAEPIWTLPVEWHIYLFAGAVYFIGARPRSALLLIPIAVIVSGVPVHYAFGAKQPDGVGASLFLLWLGGACGFLLLRDWRWYPPAWISLALAAGATAAFVARTRPSTEYDPAGYPLILLALLGLVCAGQASRRIVSSPRAVRVIRFFAGYSFSLYLIHHTLMYPIFLVWPNGGWIEFLPAVIAANLLSAAVAMQTEMRHKAFARWLLAIPRAVLSPRTSTS
jgi:peptidoglycan/LPS O-acetylase OafA/YrhL